MTDEKLTCASCGNRVVTIRMPEGYEDGTTFACRCGIKIIVPFYTEDDSERAFKKATRYEQGIQWIKNGTGLSQYYNKQLLLKDSVLVFIKDSMIVSATIHSDGFAYDDFGDEIDTWAIITLPLMGDFAPLEKRLSNSKKETQNEN
jgi:DNA-directed RNA polymerase subunit RPC12/RpoP